MTNQQKLNSAVEDFCLHYLDKAPQEGARYTHEFLMLADQITKTWITKKAAAYNRRDK